MAGDDFNNVASVEQAILQTFDSITVIAPINDGETQLIFTSHTEGPDDEVVYKLREADTQDLNNYKGNNIVTLGALSPEGMERYQIEAVTKALDALPEDLAMDAVLGDRELVIVPVPEAREGWEMPENGMDARVVQQIFSGNMDQDTARDIIIENDLQGVLIGALNDSSLDVDTDAINASIEEVYIASDLSNYSNTVSTALDGPLEDIGVSERDATNARNIVAGEPTLPPLEVVPEGQKI